jgi:hypothetical protein
MIKNLMIPLPENVPDVAIKLWERMKIKIISVIGEGGFNALYARSLYLSGQKFPLFSSDSQSPQNDIRFKQLKTSFEGLSPEQVSEANSLLLITFTDILASLIGEQLTTLILHSAWDNDASLSLQGVQE